MSNKWLLFALAVLPVLALDQGSKLWATAALQSGPLVVHPAWFSFVYAENAGAAWSFLAGAKASLRDPFFIVVGLVMISLIFMMFVRTQDKFKQWGLVFVLGGALGNLADRLRLGHVVDFISWHVGNTYYWPVFNVADAALFIGVALLFLESLRSSRPSTVA